MMTSLVLQIFLMLDSSLKVVYCPNLVSNAFGNTELFFQSDDVTSANQTSCKCESVSRVGDMEFSKKKMTSPVPIKLV